MFPAGGLTSVLQKFLSKFIRLCVHNATLQSAVDEAGTHQRNLEAQVVTVVHDCREGQKVQRRVHFDPHSLMIDS